ncbi:hypothetical protein AB0F46_35280 [Streptomyces sp. NPDC026665]|uniref:hypothetical protein n=1 Tax=Streptomyces sp. NPDC026665 TaxID=3154798 RepID=UPI00340BBDF1
MTIHRRHQRGPYAGAALLITAATASATQGLHVVAAVFCAGAAVLLEAAVREGRRHRRVRAQHERARRRACGQEPLAPLDLDPCCAFWLASEGASHSRGCHRPSTSPGDHLAAEPDITTKGTTP